MLRLREINQRLKVHLIELEVTIQGALITPLRLSRRGRTVVQAQAQVRPEIAIHKMFSSIVKDNRSAWQPIYWPDGLGYGYMPTGIGNRIYHMEIYK